MLSIFSYLYWLFDVLCISGLFKSFFGGCGEVHCVACGILVPRPLIEPVPPAVECGFFNHWIAREVPCSNLLTIYCVIFGFTAFLELFTYFVCKSFIRKMCCEYFFQSVTFFWRAEVFFHFDEIQFISFFCFGLCFKKIKKNLGIVDLQWCVSFNYTVKWYI